MSREDFELVVETVSTAATLVLLTLGVWAAIHFGRAAKKQELLTGHQRDLAGYERGMTLLLNSCLRLGRPITWDMLRGAPIPPPHHEDAIVKPMPGQHRYNVVCAYIASGQVSGIRTRTIVASHPAQVVSSAMSGFGFAGPIDDSIIQTDGTNFAAYFGEDFIIWAHRVD